MYPAPTACGRSSPHGSTGRVDVDTGHRPGTGVTPNVHLDIVRLPPQGPLPGSLPPPITRRRDQGRCSPESLCSEPRTLLETTVTQGVFVPGSGFEVDLRGLGADGGRLSRDCKPTTRVDPPNRLTCPSPTEVRDPSPTHTTPALSLETPWGPDRRGDRRDHLRKDREGR